MKLPGSDDIDRIEAELGLTLPRVYRDLLVRKGHGESEPQEIHHPAEIRGLYEPFFDDPRDLFRRYFPIGCDNRTQEVWIVDVGTGRVASISHETVPDDWEDEDWMEPEAWVRENIDF